MTEKEIDRINELARKSKTQGLSEEEKIEQKALRVKYINSFKESLEGQLNSLVIVEPDGTKRKVTKKQ
ncbi:MAG: DUF896 domain-containing protein [Clostridia bacterium]|nr:DUF896 domain-containing protein [Clostridia bacterium]